MNPLIPTNAIQCRYVSPIYEPVYDEDDNVVDDECVERGTDVLSELIIPTSNDKVSRYYRLRHRQNAKDHKRRWEKWLESNLINDDRPLLVRVKKIGRRVLFEYDSKLMEKREKKLKAEKHKAKLKLKEKFARADTILPAEKDSFNEWLNELAQSYPSSDAGQDEVLLTERD